MFHLLPAAKFTLPTLRVVLHPPDSREFPGEAFPLQDGGQDMGRHGSGNVASDEAYGQ